MDISYRHLDEGITVLSIKGRLDAITSLAVKQVLQKIIDTEQPKIIIDLQEVPFIDSSGLASLVSGLRLAREKDGTIVLSGVQSQARTVFHLTMMDRVFSIHTTNDEAVQSLL
jgi:anti-sigma B factor antagonist